MTTIETATPTPTPTPVSTATPAGTSHSFLRPAGSDAVTQRDLVRELVRWPAVLFIPLSVFVLVMVGLHLAAIAIVPLGAALATVATVTAARRASARAVAQRERAVLSLMPTPRSGG